MKNETLLEIKTLQDLLNAIDDNRFQDGFVFMSNGLFSI